MPRDNSGTYTRPPSNPVAAGTIIEADWANDTTSDIATALTQSISSTGKTTPTANLPMGGFRHTGVADPNDRAQYLTLGMAQDTRDTRLTTSATGNAIVGTMTGWTPSSPSAYSAGMEVSWVQTVVNTGAVTISIGSLGVKSVVSSSGTPLIAGDLEVGKFYMAFYDSTQFVIFNEVASQASSSSNTTNISGWRRPDGLVAYPVVTRVSDTVVAVPAGSGIQQQQGAGGLSTVTPVSWAAQNVTITNVATEYFTVLMADTNGAIVQYNTQPPPSALRSYVMIATIEHLEGIVGAITMHPAIQGDDGYLSRDTTYVLGNQLVTGGKITGTGTAPGSLVMTISDGTIYMPGGSADNPLNPNYATITAASTIPFYYLDGTDGLSASSTLVVLSNYDPAGAGTVTALTGAGNATIHRLFWLNGKYIWVYGQAEYADYATAVASIIVDRSNFLPSPKIASAVLIAEIIATKAATTLATAGASTVISGSGTSYSFGAGGSIADAPAGPALYGRRTGAWAACVEAATPSVTGNVTITKVSPRVVQVADTTAGWSGLEVKNAANAWFSIQVTTPGNTVNLVNNDPTTGTITATTTIDGATGGWTYPAGASYGGTGAIKFPAGTTLQRPTPVNGMIRYNSDAAAFEGYAGGAWGAIAGSGGGVVDGTFYTNPTTITADYTLASNTNAMTAGPITIADGITVTIPDGSAWTVV